ncbi:uncharacterized protein LOC131881013 isoform X1 [Tigriopus californicus]|uniref:uncharacterized protein LOC131881013 isoform X1 n=1 Tax=Tigriopus californicus TaxID=6832 RepID=UPI0027DA1431|nr:uncharacterized protein LOC131881013 isoform X1 [Tigriopus californicus]
MSTIASTSAEGKTSSLPEGESTLDFIRLCLNRLGQPEADLAMFVSEECPGELSDASGTEPTEWLALLLVRSYPICNTTPELTRQYNALCEWFIRDCEDLKFLVIIVLSWDYEINEKLHAPAILILLKHAFLKAQNSKLWEFIVDSLLDILESKSVKFSLAEMLDRFFYPLSKSHEVSDRVQKIVLSRGVYFCAKMLLRNPDSVKDQGILVETLVCLNPNGVNILDWTEETDEDPRNYQYLGRLLSFHEICNKVGSFPQVYSPLFMLKVHLTAFRPFNTSTTEMNSMEIVSVLISLLDCCCSRIQRESLETDWATFSDMDSLFKWLTNKMNSDQGIPELQARTLFSLQAKLYSKFKPSAKVFLLMRIHRSAGPNGASVRSWVVSNLKDLFIRDFEILDKHQITGFLSDILDIRDTLENLDCAPEWVAILNCSYCLKAWDSDGSHGVKSIIEDKMPNVVKRAQTMINETRELLRNQSGDQLADPSMIARFEFSLQVIEIALSRW